jgi:Ser/Thr protein kinase RdoA (MazF antagonist)
MNKMHESNHTKWNAILGDYDLAGPNCITELKPDTAWHIDHPSGQWVIAKRPIYDPGSRRVERLEAASHLMTELHRAGQLWVHAKRNKDGRYITVKDTSLYQVTSFDEGENTWNLETPEMLPDVGRAMGAYHRYQETSSFDAQLAIHDFIGMTLNGLENRRQEILTIAADRKPPIEAIDEAINRFRAITPALMTLPSGLVHMDLGSGNALFKNGRLSAIIDFEAFFAPFILDIGIAGLYWAIPFDPEMSDTRVDPGRLKTLLESYAEERSLGQDEILALKDAFVWCAIRKWSQGMGSNPHSRYDAYRCCLDLDSDWLESCFA